ncbi:hypothetical protein DFP73DRAFT_591484 [Morchella snyderi]|nr:hypothetical protein DFP73DRAFT_591484 [Morchella snyderi]
MHEVIFPDGEVTEVVQRQKIEELLRSFGDGHLKIPFWVLHLVHIYLLKGDPTKAEQPFEKGPAGGIDIQNRIKQLTYKAVKWTSAVLQPPRDKEATPMGFGPDDCSSNAETRIVQISAGENKWKEAGVLQKDVLNYRRESLGADHRHTLGAVAALLRAYWYLSQLSNARGT